MADSLQNLDTVGYKRIGLSKRNAKDLKGKSHGIMKVLFRHLPEKTESGDRIVTVLTRDLNEVPLEYRTMALTLCQHNRFT
jgi:hypothetical protein